MIKQHPQPNTEAGLRFPDHVALRLDLHPVVGGDDCEDGKFCGSQGKCSASKIAGCEAGPKDYEACGPILFPGGDD